MGRGQVRRVGRLWEARDGVRTRTLPTAWESYPVTCVTQLLIRGAFHKLPVISTRLGERLGSFRWVSRAYLTIVYIILKIGNLIVMSKRIDYGTNWTTKRTLCGWPPPKDLRFAKYIQSTKIYNKLWMLWLSCNFPWSNNWPSSWVQVWS